MSDKCLCGSGHKTTDCCLAIINASKQASTAEELMRSRYTAYVLKDFAYLSATWHHSTRPGEIVLENEPVKWVDLKILNTEAGMDSDESGIVEFIARFKVNGKMHKLHECSRFRKEHNQWFYVDGELK